MNLESSSKQEKADKRSHRVFSGASNLSRTRFPLRITLPAATFLVTLVLMLGTGFSFYNESQRLVLKQESEDLRDESELFKLLFEQVYRQSASDVVFLSGMPPIKALVESILQSDELASKQSLQRLETIFLEMLLVNKGYRQLRYIELANDGKELVNVIRRPDGVEIVPQGQLQSKGHRSYVKEAASQDAGHIYFSPIELNREHGKLERPLQPVMRVAVPIYNMQSNNVLGVVVINVDFGHIFSKLEEIDLKELVFYLANERGDFLYHPDKNKRFGFEFGTPQLIQEAFPALLSVFEQRKENASFSNLKDIQGSDLASYYREITLDEYGGSRPVRMLLRHQSNAAGMGLKAYRDLSLLLSAFAAFTLMGLTVFAISRIVRPLASMNKAIENYETSGDLTNLPVSSQDEIGSLARNFRHLVFQFEEYSDKLNAIVNAMVDAIIVIDSSGKVLSSNDAAQHIFGYNENEITQQDIGILITVDFLQIEIIQETLKNLTPELGAKGFDLIGLSKRGNAFSVHLSITKVETSDGTIFTCVARDTTEQTQAKKELQESHQQLTELSLRTRFALKAPGIGVWDYDHTNQHLVWDERMFELYGIREGDFSGDYTAWEKSIHPDDLKRVLKTFNESMSTDEDFDIEFRVCRPNGEVRYIEAHGRLFNSEADGSVRMVGTNTDITERKLAEREILKLSSIARQTDNVVVVTDIDGKTEWVNEAFTKCTEYTPDEVIGLKPGHLLQGPETDPKTVEAIRAALKARTPCQFEIVNYRKSGEPYWIELRINPILDENGVLQGFMALEMEVSQRKDTEEKIARQQNMLESMSRHGKIGAWELDVAAQKIYWSSMTKIIHEVPADFEPNLETGINFYKEGESRDTISKAVSEAMEKGTPWNNELQLVTAKGKDIWVTATGQAEFKNGKCVRLYGSFQDIEERKRTEYDLTCAKEVAEAAVEAKNQFLASMSHEIRTPMNGVLGMLGLMMRDDLNNDQMHRAQLAKSSGESLLTIINDILDFSKVEAGKLELEIIDFDLHTLLAEFSETMAHRAEDRGLEIVLDTTEINHSIVRGDPGRLRQILTNLVGNALKFTKEGQILIRASLTEEDDKSYRLECDVQDSGIGIPSEKADKLFDAFTQVDASTTRKYGGTGLGLAIVKKLCGLMGGDIKVISEHGRGSCFSLSIKLLASSFSPEQPRIDLTGAPVLIVDNNATSRTALRAQLEHWGAQINEAEDGQTALAHMDQVSESSALLRSKVIIINMKLPDMEGQELGRIIRTDSEYRETKLIMLTSTARRGDALFFTKLGFDVCISKPVNQSSLVNALSKCGFVNVSKTGPSSSDATYSNDGLNEALSPLESTMALPSDTRLLVVEDNYINQEVAKGLLENMGLSCDLAANGKEAISALVKSPIETPYDLVIMDCQMPEMDGYEATRQIRQGNAGKNYCDIPIIALTANAIKGDREVCLAAGMNDYLSKPLNPNALEKMLRKWLHSPEDEQTTSGNSVKEIGQDKKNLELIDANNGLLNSLSGVALWDKETALKRMGFNEELLSKVINMFLADLPQQQATIEQAIKVHDYDTAAKMAHSIKGSSASVGADRLSSVSAQLEASCKSEHTTAIEAIMVNFEIECQALQECLIRHIE